MRTLIIIAAVVLVEVVAGTEAGVQDAPRPTPRTQPPALQQPITERPVATRPFRLEALLEGLRGPIIPRDQTLRNQLRMAPDPQRRWPFRADPRRWPKLFANTTECTLSFDPIRRRHWFD